MSVPREPKTGMGIWHCFECGSLERMSSSTTRFCPHCHAKADETTGDFIDEPPGYVVVDEGEYVHD